MMLEMETTRFLEELSSAKPVPGGGGAAAAVGAMGAALGLMVANLTIGKKKYAGVEAEIEAVRKKLFLLRDRLVLLTDKDAEGFEPLANAYRLPRDTAEERAEKEHIMEAALYQACLVPIEIMETALEAMELLAVLEEKGSALAVSDVGTGILFLQSALEGASLNVFINTNMMKNKERAKECCRQTEELIKMGEERKAHIYKKVLAKIRS